MCLIEREHPQNYCWYTWVSAKFSWRSVNACSWLPPWNAILFLISLIPISPTCCQWLWNVNHPLKAISVWYVAPRYSEEHLHTSALSFIIPPQINSLLYRPPFPLSFLLCMFVCVGVFVPVWHESTPAPYRSEETRTKREREPGRDGEGEQLEEGAGT